MDSGKTILWVFSVIGIGTAITAVAIAANSQFEKLQQSDFELSDLKFLQIRPDLDSVIVSFNLKITNKSDIDIAISKQFYEIFFNENQVARIVSKQKHILRAKKVSKVPLLAQFSPKKIFKDVKSDLVNLLLNLNDALNKSKIRIRGHLDFSVIGIGMKRFPVDLEYTVREIRES